MYNSYNTSRCPFCGARDLHIVTASYEIGYYVCCLNCECQGPVGETLEQSLEKWDNRLMLAEALVL